MPAPRRDDRRRESVAVPGRVCYAWLRVELFPIDEACTKVLFKSLQLEGFFPELTPDEARMLFPRSVLLRYPADTVVIQQGEAERDLYVILTGGVGVSQTFGQGEQAWALC